MNTNRSTLTETQDIRLRVIKGMLSMAQLAQKVCLLCVAISAAVAGWAFISNAVPVWPFALATVSWVVAAGLAKRAYESIAFLWIHSCPCPGCLTARAEMAKGKRDD